MAMQPSHRSQSKRGETDKALSNFARAVEFDPRNAILAYQHGLALMDSIKSGHDRRRTYRRIGGRLGHGN
jgi:hypothetical protein